MVNVGQSISWRYFWIIGRVSIDLWLLFTWTILIAWIFIEITLMIWNKKTSSTLIKSGANRNFLSNIKILMNFLNWFFLYSVRTRNDLFHNLTICLNKSHKKYIWSKITYIYKLQKFRFRHDLFKKLKQIITQICQ